VLLVQVPEAEPVVREDPLRLDPVTEKGVPAHVTALFPFVAVDGLDDEGLDLVASGAAGHPAFSHSFRTTGWFEGAALWLATNDPLPSVRLSEDLAEDLPRPPRLRRRVRRNHPTQLAVARSTTHRELEGVERELLPALPLNGRASHLTLMREDSNGRWSVAAVPAGELTSTGARSSRPVADRLGSARGACQ